jgi:hypothetical protein
VLQGPCRYITMSFAGRSGVDALERCKVAMVDGR